VPNHYWNSLTLKFTNAALNIGKRTYNYTSSLNHFKFYNHSEFGTTRSKYFFFFWIYSMYKNTSNLYISANILKGGIYTPFKIIFKDSLMLSMRGKKIVDVLLTIKRFLFDKIVKFYIISKRLNVKKSECRS
jgi:hypothetical protein